MIEKTNGHFKRLEDQIKDCRMTIEKLLEERKEMARNLETSERVQKLIEDQLLETRMKLEKAEKIIRTRKIS